MQYDLNKKIDCHSIELNLSNQILYGQIMEFLEFKSDLYILIRLFEKSSDKIFLSNDNFYKNLNCVIKNYYFFVNEKNVEIFKLKNIKIKRRCISMSVNDQILVTPVVSLNEHD